MRYGSDESRELMEILEDVPDPRCTRGVRYRFSHLLLMCVYAVLAGHSAAMEIAYYVELNFDYFRELLKIEKVPSHDTFSRVLRYTDFKALSSSLGEWLRENFTEVYEKYQDKKALHIDGKAARGGSEKSKGEKPVYHLNAMYEGGSIGVEIKRVGEKENEISGLPDYLKQFDLKDTVVTMDAMGCNQTVIKAIRKEGGNYVLPVKENQKRLLGTVNEEIEKMIEKGMWDKLERTEVLQKGHGRIERIVFRMLTDTSFVYEKLGLKSFYGTIARIGVMDKTVEMMKEGEEVKTKSRSIFITDVENITVEVMQKIRAAHWNIEMQHWLLDIQLREDQQTARRDDAVTNGSILRRFCMAIKKQDAELSEKPMKRFLMANEHDPNRIEKLLFKNTAQEEA
ncbi:ISAs1 family transposase [Schaedlerella sp.]|uniref:ISAs1 family transposase n=1 Tax=Schaedlerella sp. TaxID=2676057 RepID=UPI00374635B1